jgi:dihydroneopterin aldolase
MHAARGAQSKSLRVTMTVFLTNYVTDVLIGIDPNERTRRQKMRIDIEATTSCAARQHTIDDVLDYNMLREGVKTIVDGGHIDFQETFCHRIICMCLSLPRVSKARVRVAKLEAFSDCEAVGCEISRSKKM